jgi:hypothetical protein
VRDQVMAELYRQIRPVERSYRLVQLFFENAEVRDTLQRPPVEFYVFNADTRALRSDTDSTTVAAVDEFVQSRNDTFNFRQFICNLVVPGYVNDRVRKRFEEIASQWGMLLVGDLRDEPSFRALSDQFRTDGGSYEFLKRAEDRAAADVVVAGWVKLRDRHWFEDGEGDADLYGPASLLFAGALARTDRTTGGGIAQGPVGMIFGQLRGAERARIEPRISQMEHLSMERQIVSIIRNEDNHLCFVGSRSQAQDPNGVLKFFTSYRVLRYIERRIAVYLRRVAEQRLTRDLVKDQVRNPIEEFLDGEKKKGHHLQLRPRPRHGRGQVRDGAARHLARGAAGGAGRVVQPQDRHPEFPEGGGGGRLARRSAAASGAPAGGALRVAAGARGTPDAGRRGGGDAAGRAAVGAGAPAGGRLARWWRAVRRWLAGS